MSAYGAGTTAKFLEGSIFQHLAVLTVTQSIGLMIIFMVDVVDTYFLSHLNNPAILAGVGYATALTFMATSIGIGLAIAGGATVAQQLGQGNEAKAKQFATTILCMAFGVGVVMALVLFGCGSQLLRWMGAQHDTLQFALQFLQIGAWTSIPILVAIVASGVLRANGLAMLAMRSQMVGGFVNVLLNPILISGLGLGVRGSAWATFSAMTLMAAYALWLLHSRQLYQRHVSWESAVVMGLIKIAAPAVATNIMMPLTNTYILQQMGQFGAQATAGMTVLNRLLPIAFVGILSLSGAVGPVVGQNFGAKRWDRIVQTLQSSAVLIVGYCGVVCTLLWVLHPWLSQSFRLAAGSAALVAFFCQYLSFSYIFNGLHFTCNACFNNIGKPNFAMLSNVMKATVGTIPFVYWGAQCWGAEGILIGQAFGSVVSGLLTVVWIGSVLRQRLGEGKKSAVV